MNEISLIPLAIPIIANIFIDRAVISPTTVSFPCEVTGQPTPDVIWTFNGVMVKSGIKYSFDTSHTLIVSNVSHASDAGLYRCTATNIHGSDSAQAELQIQGKIPFSACCLSFMIIAQHCRPSCLLSPPSKCYLACKQLTDIPLLSYRLSTTSLDMVQGQFTNHLRGS